MCLVLGPRGELAKQPALSDPGFACHKNEAALVESGHQGKHLCVATDEDGANVHGVILTVNSSPAS
jgi:hypothetical protein